MAEIYDKGQVVIPKYLRDEFKMYPGTQVAFKRADKGVLVVPAYAVQEEMEKLRKEGATMSDAQVRQSMREMEKKRLKEMLDVPGLSYFHQFLCFPWQGRSRLRYTHEAN